MPPGRRGGGPPGCGRRRLRSAGVDRRRWSARPSTSTVPLARGRVAQIASASSRCPLPATPHTATISPACRSNDTSCKRALAAIAVGAQVVHRRGRPDRDRPAVDVRRRASVVNTTSRPTISRASSRGDVSATAIGAHVAAIAQHGDAVGHGHHLVELVGDEHHRSAVGRHRPQGREQHLRFLRGEHSGRLVEDQHAGVACQRLEDLDPLLLADRELPHLRRRIDVQAHSAPRAQSPVRRSSGAARARARRARRSRRR